MRRPCVPQPIGEGRWGEPTQSCCHLSVESCEKILVTV